MSEGVDAPRAPQRGASKDAVVLETDRLVLRRLGPGDEAFILELLNQPSFIRNIGDRGVRTAEQARRYILDGPVASYARFGFGLYLVELRDGAAPIGICGLLRREWLEDADLGFALLPRYWGMGYALEAAAAVLAHGRAALGLTRIAAIVSPGNASSTRLLEKLGLRFERTVRSPDGAEVELYASGP